MSRPNRPRRQRILAPIATLAACSAAAAALVVATSAASLAPTASAAAAPAAPRHSISIPPIFPTFTYTVPVQTTVAQTTSQAVRTSAAATKTTAHAKRTATATPSATSFYVSTFTPHALPSIAAPTPASSTGCVPDTHAPTSGADLQLPQVNAGSTDPGFTNWLHVAAVGPSGMLPPALNSSNLSTFSFTRTADSESTNLGMAASSGERFPCALLDVSGGQGFRQADYALTDAGLVSDSVQGKTETLIVTYASVSWRYLPTGGSAAVTGSGTINTQPNVKQTSLKQDAKDVAAGVLGLALVCALGMLLLTLFGRHRRKVRYREIRERSRVEVPLPERQAASPMMLFGQAQQPVDEGVTVRVPPEAVAEVPDTLKTVHVAEFAHAAMAAAVPVAAGVGAGAGAATALDGPEEDASAAAEPEVSPAAEPEVAAAAEPEVSAAAEPEVSPAAEPEVSAAAEPDPADSSAVPEPDLGGGAAAGEAGPDPVDLPGPRGQDEPGELAAEVDADGEAEAGGGGGEEVGGAEAGLPADDEEHAEVGLRAGEQGDEPGDGEGQPGGAVPAGDELAAETEQDAGGGDGDGGADASLEQPGVADPGEGGAEDGVAEQPAADLQDDAEGEPEDGGGEGLQPGPAGDDVVGGGVEVDAEGDPGAQHDADPADDADDDVEDLDEPGGRGDVEGGEPVLDGGDERPAGEQGEEPAGDHG